MCFHIERNKVDNEHKKNVLMAGLSNNRLRKTIEEQVSPIKQIYNRPDRQDVAWRMLPSLHKFPICHRFSGLAGRNLFRGVGKMRALLSCLFG